jgi:competence ComEA-like helix-hairpin-helix protein
MCREQNSRVREAGQRRVLVARLALFLLIGLLLAATTQGRKRPPAQPLDLNIATAAQLAQVPGIGPTTAQAIVRFRQKSGPFRRVEDLLAIRGISQQKLERLKPYFFVIPSRPATQ